MRQSVTSIVLLAVLLGTATLDATTIATIIRADQTIIIGADSKRTVTPLTEDADPSSINSCKIRDYGDLVITATGSYPATLVDELARAIKQGADVWNDKDRVRRIIVDFAQKTMPRVLRVNPGWEYTGSNSPLTYVVGFFDEDWPVVLHYPVKQEPDEQEVDSIRVIGRASIFERLPIESVIYGLNDEIEAIRRIIGLQAEETPETVSLPADIIQLTADGTTWIHVKDECRERE